MSKRGRFGLRMKLVVAFLAISIGPLLVILLMTSYQVNKLQQTLTEFNRRDDALQTIFTQYDQEVLLLKNQIMNRVEQLPIEQSAAITEFSQSLDVLIETTMNEFQPIRAAAERDRRVNAEELQESFQKREVFFFIFISSVTFVVLALAFYIGNRLTQPVTQLTEVAEKLARGELNQTVHVRAHGEIGQLSEAFTTLTGYMQAIARSATTIAKGDLQEVIPSKGPGDLLGAAFHAMSEYLHNIARAAHLIAEGNFSDNIPVQSPRDVLGHAFQKMTSTLAGTIRQIKGKVSLVEQASETTAKRSEDDLKMVENVLSSAEETSSSMMQMQASVEEVLENMKSLSTAIEETVVSIEQMNMAIRHIATNSTGLSNSAEETFNVIQNIGESIAQVVAASQQAETSSREASESAHAGQVSVREIIQGMAVIHDVVSTAAETIKALSSRMDQIGSITNLIADIAGQTQLLALNASIIAAQAGEHGRGFAVVADEVKELANRSSLAVKDIETLIKGVQSESQKAVASMEHGRQAVENGVGLANRGGDALEKILVSVENTLARINDNTRIANQQAMLSEQVRKYMETVVSMVNEIVRATGEQQQGSGQIAEAVSNMRDLSEQVKRATIEQSKGTHHVLEAMDNVTQRVQESASRAQELAHVAAELATETHALTGLLDQFHVENAEARPLKTKSTHLA